MKLGPVHVVTEATMAWMQNALQRLSIGLADSNQEIGRLTRLLSATSDERDRLLTLLADVSAQSHRLMHHPAHATYAPNWIAQPDVDDARSRVAAERVTAAFQRAKRDAGAVDSGMWIHAERRNADFIAALSNGNAADVRRRLARLFQSGLINGLGRFHEKMPAEIQAQPIGNRVQLQFTDVLVSLAEAVGVHRTTSVEQDATEHARALIVDFAELLVRITNKTHLDLSFPQVGGAFGCSVAGRRLAIDSVVHGYAVHRFGQLGLRRDHRIGEIGGGYGCLAALMLRHGFSRYRIYDLPWVNAIQGYFLIMALPEQQICLYGEPEGDVAVLPYWQFFALPADALDVVINTDSLPEIGRPAAEAYIEKIAHTARKFFFSINQEAKAPVESFEPQNCVAELVEQHGGYARLSRQRYWMRPGYVEEVFARAT